MDLNLSAQQVRVAAQAGVQLLSDEQLPIPLGLGKTGVLGALESILIALASGQLILVNAQTSPPPDDGERQDQHGDDNDDEDEDQQEDRKLRSVDKETPSSKAS